MDIRPYVTSDRRACLSAFDSHSFLAREDRVAFETFLAKPDCPYFVMEHDGRVVGCGGYAISPDNASARLLWGMIHSDMQRQGLGRFLLMFRLREIGKLNGVQAVYVDTPPNVAPFFEKQGFRSVNIGKDRVELIKKLVVCN